jgi:hypothetical protein
VHAIVDCLAVGGPTVSKQEGYDACDEDLRVVSTPSGREAAVFCAVGEQTACMLSEEGPTGWRALAPMTRFDDAIDEIEIVSLDYQQVRPGAVGPAVRFRGSAIPGACEAMTFEGLAYCDGDPVAPRCCSLETAEHASCPPAHAEEAVDWKIDATFGPDGLVVGRFHGAPNQYTRARFEELRGAVFCP